GNVIKGRGEGMLNLQINPRQNLFEMYGDYTISEGSFLFSMQNILTRKFIIENGSTIQWTGSPMNAMLDITALYKLKASIAPLLQGTSSSMSSERAVPVECSIHLGDRLQNPTMNFNVRVPSSDAETQAVISNALTTPETIQTQFLFLLLSNSFMAENNSAFSNFGVSTSAATGIGFLTSQLNKLISTAGYNLIIDYRPKSELTSDELDFGLSKSLINDRLFIELEGNYVVDNKQAVNRNMSNFMGEAYITWRIDRSGSLKLKGFTQTIDRFDENQGLQETGVGIYYKEDFNNLKDLRQRIKERFMSKKRKAKREAEQQKIQQQQEQQQQQEKLK
ncbi:MAG: translocation/assembly module TamB domain-containing protein, partial [Alistipes sp.]